MLPIESDAFANNHGTCQSGKGHDDRKYFNPHAGLRAFRMFTQCNVWQPRIPRDRWQPGTAELLSGIDRVLISYSHICSFWAFRVTRLMNSLALPSASRNQSRLVHPLQVRSVRDSRRDAFRRNCRMEAAKWWTTRET